MAENLLSSNEDAATTTAISLIIAFFNEMLIRMVKKKTESEGADEAGVIKDYRRLLFRHIKELFSDAGGGNICE